MQNLICTNCTSLTSLEGAPEEVEILNCSNCTSLQSLKGLPKKITWRLIMTGLNFNVTTSDILKVCDVLNKKIEL